MNADYITHMGDDLLVVNAARVSMDKHHDEFLGSDEKLVKYLADHNHWTPFSHPQICMRETIPIFVARQRFKHMVGFTYNEVSRRYVDDTPAFFDPVQWRSRPEGSIKQGSGSDVVTEVTYQISKVNDQLLTQPIEDVYDHLISVARSTYQRMLDAGVAPEQARMVLPQSMYTSYYVTGSLAAWARAYKLRIDPHSQIEIQQLAKQWDEIIRPLFPSTWAALVD